KFSGGVRWSGKENKIRSQIQSDKKNKCYQPIFSVTAAAQYRAQQTGKCERKKRENNPCGQKIQAGDAKNTRHDNRQQRSVDVSSVSRIINGHPSEEPHCLHGNCRFPRRNSERLTESQCYGD